MFFSLAKAGLQVTWRSFGPGAAFSYIQKISPAIPVLRAIKESIASQFPSIIGHGARHGIPTKDKDVSKLIAMYTEARVHIHDARRDIKATLTGSNRARDIVTLGAEELVSGEKFQAWWSDPAFPKATTENYYENVTQ